MAWLELTFRFRDHRPVDSVRVDAGVGVGIGKGWAVGSEQGVHVDADPRVGGRGWNGRAFVHGADAIGEVVRHVIGVGATFFRIVFRLSHTSRSASSCSCRPVAVLVDPQIWVLSGFHPPYVAFSVISPSVRCSPMVSSAVMDGQAR